MTAPLSADDRLGILELLARYARGMDDGNLEALIACFTPEPTLDVLGKKAKGAAELRAFFAEYCKWEGRPGWQHHINAVIFEGDAARPRVRSYVMWIARNPMGGIRLQGCSNYQDDCVKLDGRWVFDHHVAHH